MMRFNSSKIRPFVALVAVTIALAVSLQAGPAEATTFDLKSNLDPDQALFNNPGASGSGFGAITYNNQTNLLTWDISFGGLAGATLQAHFHGPAPAGQNGEIQVTISVAPASPMIGSATISETQESQLVSGLWYVNIHTDHSPSGEIRGQVLDPSGGPIGGVAELPDAGPVASLQSDTSSGTSWGLLGGGGAAIVAVAVVLLGAAARYRQRRAQPAE